MSNTLESAFPRRKFLVGAIGALGASVVGLSPVAALAKIAPSKVLTLALWDGAHFTPANRLPSGDSTLKTVQLTIRGYNNEAGPIKAIDAYFVVPTGSTKIHAPFSAWVAPPRGASTIRYIQSVDSALGVLLKAQLSDSSGSTASTVGLITGTAPGAKLKVGTYVLIDGAWDMSQFTLDLTNKEAPLTRALGSGPVPQYLVIDIARA